MLSPLRARSSPRAPALVPAFLLWVLLSAPVAARAESFSFAVTSDTWRYAGTTGAFADTAYFEGVCQAIERFGPVAFMVSVGDINPPEPVEATVRQVFGEDFLWYPVVGNHDAESEEYMPFFRAYDYDPNGDTPPNIARTGPPGAEETCYSFDYGNAHFVAINEYYDGESDVALDGDVCDALYEWLAADLAATGQEHIFVFGHEPAFPQGDDYSLRHRHVGDSLDKYPEHRDRFWELLRNEGVTAYFNGHTHNASAYFVDRVWQIDSGHSCGACDELAPSTAVIVRVEEDRVRFDAYRDLHDGVYDYDDLVRSGYLAAPSLDTLLASGAEWRYRCDGLDRRSAWRYPGFDDGEWPAGPSQLGYGDGDEATVAADGPDADEEWPITAYFRAPFTVDDPGLIVGLVVRLLRDDGAVVYVNGVEVARNNMPGGEPGYGTRATYIMNNADESEPLTLSAPSSMLVRGTNVVAAEIHQVTEYSDDMSFDLELLAWAEDLTDADGDGIPVAREGDGDRDGDGLANDEDYDPTGYLYDERTGALLEGGRVSVSGPGAATMVRDGSDGSYRFTVDSAGVYTLSVTAPAGYHAAEECLAGSGPYDARSAAGPHVLGSGEDGESGHLVSSDCTAYYRELDLPPGGAAVVENNIPFRADLPAATALAGFSAEQVGWDVRVAWETSEETGAATFRVLRKEPGRDEFVPVGDSLYVGTTDGTGASYFLVDTPASKGELTYRLEIAAGGVPESSHETTLPAFLPVPAGYRFTAAPNPFNAVTELRFDLPEEGDVSLEIFDVRGRLVSRLRDGREETGYHTLAWNGDNQRGEPLPTGVYFCRFRSGSFESNRKLVLLH